MVWEMRRRKGKTDSDKKKTNYKKLKKVYISH
jgi:hypothetical protein